METQKLDLGRDKKSTWSRMITPHGEVDVETPSEGDPLFYPLKTEELKPLPDKFKVSHASELGLFHDLLTVVAKQQPNRMMPVTRNEYLRSGGDPKLLKQLVEFGLLKECLVARRDKNGNNTGSRACLYYTDQGRAFIRARRDPAYALTDYKDGGTQNG